MPKYFGDLFARAKLNLLKINQLCRRLSSDGFCLVRLQVFLQIGASITSCLAVTEDLNHILNRFWKVDHTISSLKFSPEHQACENLFRDTVKRNSDGRFVVQLPVKSDKLSKLGDYKEIAIRRLKCLEKRFLTSPKMHTEYKQFLLEYMR